jgi:hypothetical protein
LRSAGVKPDERVAEVINLLINKQHQNGRWQLQNPHLEQVNFPMEGPVGAASRWNTMRSLRVFEWKEQDSNLRPPPYQAGQPLKTLK